MKTHYLLPIAISLVSCVQQDRDSFEELASNEILNYILPNGEKITLKTSIDGFDILYLGENKQFSLHGSDGEVRTSADIIKGSEYTSIIDLDGDFLPDYMMKNEKRIKLKTIEEK